MSPSKGSYAPGQAYVAFSRVRELNRLHIINYTRSQIKISPTVADEMQKLRENLLPEIPPNLFKIVNKSVKLLHINVGNIMRKFPDIQNEDVYKCPDIICFNETHLRDKDKISSEMLNVTQDMVIFRKDRNIFGGGVAVLVD